MPRTYNFLTAAIKVAFVLYPLSQPKVLGLHEA